jgi:hypothetical protein
VTHLAWSGDNNVAPPSPEYLGFVKRKAMNVTAKACASTCTAELAWMSADATGIGGNRNSKDGPTDPEVGALCIREQGTGQMFAMVMVYGMHPTVLLEDSKLVSADFPHYTRLHLRECFGDSLAVLYCQGPCADQGPRHFVKEHTFEEAERFGRQLGELVAERARLIPDEAFAMDCELSARHGLAELPNARELPSLWDAKVFLGECRARYEELSSAGADPAILRVAQRAIVGAEGTMALLRLEGKGEIAAALPLYKTVEIQALEIAGTCIVGVPGELFAEHGLQIKERAERKTFVVNLVNGELQGYIPTAEVATTGKYEALNALFPPEAATKLIDGAVDLLNRKADPDTLRQSALRPNLRKLEGEVEQQRLESEAERLRRQALAKEEDRPNGGVSWLG